MKIKIGQIVRYKISEHDKAYIEAMGCLNRNPHSVGQEIPLIICNIFQHEYGENIPGVNGQAFLDGNSTLWITSAKEGTNPGEWHV